MTGGDDSPATDDSTDLRPLGRAPTIEEARHLLSRTCFASTEQAVADVASMGLNAYLDRMLAVGEFAGVAELEKATLASKHAFDPAVAEASYRWLSFMLTNPNPFQEVLALLWNDHFGTTFISLEVGSRQWAAENIAEFRNKGVGSFKELTVAMSMDPVMLLCLNGVDSTRTAPNENFARELWELFTLGRDNGYTQADIVQAAKCFTGFEVREQDPSRKHMWVEFNPERHDVSNKEIFGATVAGRSGKDGYLEYRDVVELTFKERDPAPHVVRKLWEYFVYRDPPQPLVAQLSAELRADDWYVGRFLKKVFSSRAFYSQRARAGLVKSPVEFAVGFVRATGLRYSLPTLHSRLRTMRQCPGYSPGVDGWPSGEQWISADGQVQRANCIAELLDFKADDNPMSIVHLFYPEESRRNPDAVIDTLAVYAKVTPSSEERRQYVHVLNGKGVAGAKPFDSKDPALIGRAVEVLQLLRQHVSYGGPEVARRVENRAALERLLPPAPERSAGAVLTALVQHLNMSIEPAERTLYETYLNTRRDAEGKVSDDPFDGTNAEHLDERLRGLVYMLAQNPSYQFR